MLEAGGPQSAKAEITVNIGPMGMKLTGPVTIESADNAAAPAGARAPAGEDLAARGTRASLRGADATPG